MPPIRARNQEEAQSVNNRIREKIDAPKSQPSESDIEWIQAVTHEYPMSDYFNTLGVTQYRAGNYEEAVEAILTSVKLKAKEQTILGPDARDLAVLAMSHFKLGNKREANKYRKAFDKDKSGSNYEGESGSKAETVEYEEGDPFVSISPLKPFAKEVKNLFDSNT